MDNQKVSIITPCFNAARYIAETLESVLAQSYSDWELIVVDDGSTDESVRIIGDFCALDKRVNMIRQSNRGSSAARNSGIRRAKGRYIALLDADDVWDPDFLSSQIAFMKDQNAICVCCAYRHIDAESREIQHPTVPKAVITRRDMQVMNHVGCLTGLYDTARHGKVFLREELKSLRDDYAYWYDIACLEDGIRGNPQVLASYRVLNTSTTGNKLRLISRQYAFYRKYLEESFLTAGINTLRWGLSGLKKFS